MMAVIVYWVYKTEPPDVTGIFTLQAYLITAEEQGNTKEQGNKGSRFSQMQAFNLFFILGCSWDSVTKYGTL